MARGQMNMVNGVILCRLRTRFYTAVCYEYIVFALPFFGDLLAYW